MLTALGLPGVRLLSFDTAGELPSATFACLLLLGVPLLRRDSLPNMLAAHEEAISILTVSTHRAHDVAHMRCFVDMKVHSVQEPRERKRKMVHTGSCHCFVL